MERALAPPDDSFAASKRTPVLLGLLGALLLTSLSISVSGSSTLWYGFGSLFAASPAPSPERDFRPKAIDQVMVKPSVPGMPVARRRRAGQERPTCLFFYAGAIPSESLTLGLRKLTVLKTLGLTA
eukprot:g41554.t1